MLDKKINLAFIGTYPDISADFLEITRKMDNVHAISIDASFDEAVYEAKKKALRLDAILSRGGTADYIIRAVEIPVITIPITPFDLVRVIHTLDRNVREVAFIHYHKNVPGVKEIAQMYQIEILEYLFMDYKDIEEGVQDAKEKGIKVIIGGEVAAKIAAKNNMQGIVISAGHEAIARAIDETLQVIYEKQKAQHYSTQLKAAFDSLVEGIIITDEERRVVVFNSVAEKIFQKSYRAGDPVGNEIIDTKSEENDKSFLKRVGGSTYAVSHTAVMLDGKFVGTVSRYEDITKVQLLEEKIRKEIHSKGFAAKYTFEDIISESQQMRNILRMAQIFAGIDSSILIDGESGTGKELFAQGIHNASKRQNGPFVAINCNAIPENLLESELFGYESGAFTGAKKEGKPGLFELAHGGTLFLDEIGELTASVQARLLRVLQEREIMRVGGNRIIPVDVRVISATNKNLLESTEKGAFRRDLYYRLNVFNLHIPPLRERLGDIKCLFKAFAQKHKLSPEDETFDFVLFCMERYHWPGNVRQLQNVVERYCVLKSIGDENIPDALELCKILGLLPAEDEGPASAGLASGKKLKDMIEALESDIINRTLAECGNDHTLAAQRLGIGMTTLWRKTKRGMENTQADPLQAGT
ncbi:MAG: sigma 54-interacting transcriptional regulator [Oscillospiraceae bacterium]|jgi:transcriptional regulator with PAS, ATPase and Fis domain|nr:sigma 54-interacting transcriptional regulator [Oscillospiraceae bacterium]